MEPEDIAAILAAADSWPAAVVAVALAVAFVAWKMIPRMKEIADSVSSLRAEFRNNGGSTMRDAVDRIERKTAENTASLDEHVRDAEVWRQQIARQVENIRQGVSS